jgi:hypothetical protein
VAGGPNKRTPTGAIGMFLPDGQYAEYVILNRTAVAVQEAGQ